MVGCRNGATFDPYVLVYVFLQSFIIIVDIALVLDYVAVGSVVWWVDGNDVALVARMLDFLGLELEFAYG